MSHSCSAFAFVVVVHVAGATLPRPDALCDGGSCDEAGDDSAALLQHTRIRKDDWKVPTWETEWDAEKKGDLEELTRCRQELATKYPSSLWRSQNTSKYEIQADVDVPADLVWEGRTNSCASPHMVNLYYPKAFSGPLPLISFAHGFKNGGEALDKWNRDRFFQPLAEEGFFVIAYQHGDTWEYCSNKYNQLGQIAWLKNHSRYATMIDFKKIGLYGYSMGGKATLKSAAEAPEGVQVAVTINAHCTSDCPTPTVPTLMLSGDRDTVAQQWEERKVFNRLPATGAFASMPMKHGFGKVWMRLAIQPLVTSMFRCHLLDDQDACSGIQDRDALERTCFDDMKWKN